MNLSSSFGSSIVVFINPLPLRPAGGHPYSFPKAGKVTAQNTPDIFKKLDMAHSVLQSQDVQPSDKHAQVVPP